MNTTTESPLTFHVDNALKSAFADVAKQQDNTVAQLLQDFMRNYVTHNRQDMAYEAWFCRKVEAGRKAAREGNVLSTEEVTARAMRRKAVILEGRIA